MDYSSLHSIGERFEGYGNDWGTVTYLQAAYHIGHTGHGCQQVMVDLGNGISVGYTNNALKVYKYLR